MTDKKPTGPLTLGQRIALGVLAVGVGSVFLAGCYRAVLWILGVG